MRILALLACMTMAALTVTIAHADTTVQVVGTWPTGDSVTLGRNQTLYLHLRYSSGRPVQIWAQPYFEGKPTRAGSNPSRIYPAGDGEALAWFFLSGDDAQVDDVRISAGDGTTAGTHVVADYPIQVSGGDAPADTSAAPAWVSRLRAMDKAAQDAAYQQRMSEPVSTGDLLLFNGFMLAMFGIGFLGFAWPAWGLWRWRGIWRIAAAIPAAIFAFVVLRLILGVAVDPTSHNLWPFEILMVGGISTAIMIVLAIARKLGGAMRRT